MPTPVDLLNTARESLTLAGSLEAELCLWDSPAEWHHVPLLVAPAVGIL
jgi:hypothetical protein